MIYLSVICYVTSSTPGCLVWSGRDNRISQVKWKCSQHYWLPQLYSITCRLSEGISKCRGEYAHMYITSHRHTRTHTLTDTHACTYTWSCTILYPFFVACPSVNCLQCYIYNKNKYFRHEYSNTWSVWTVIIKNKICNYDG